VKDGATAIAALGQDIDTALVDLKGGTTGQILAKASNTDLDYSWVTNDVGDITAVTAGTGLTGGGTSGTVSLAFDQANFGGGQYAAGKNKIINGDFSVNQRNFTSTSLTATFGFDRWYLNLSGGTATYSAETFTLGTAPVAGYESKNFARVATTVGNDYCRLDQKIENVRTLAGQTVTVSFWAKGTNPTTAGSLNVTVIQSFGDGGSPSSLVIQNFGSFVLTANWTRYSLTATVPSIAGKTIGTAGNDNLSFGFGQGANTSTDAWTLDLWGVQVEAGSTASPFQTATGTIQGELAACQRYFQKSYNQVTAPATNSQTGGIDFTPCLGAVNTNVYIGFVKYPVVMRTAPSVTIYSFASSTTSVVSNATGTDLAASSGIASLIGDSGFTVQNTSGGIITAASGGFIFHHIANAEL
jgi:hypothetical protein